jgi:hypothetical protein
MKMQSQETKMKRRITKCVLTLIAFTCVSPVAWAYDSGSACKDPTDPKCLGAFNPKQSILVQLPADGILNYTTVDIPAGVTVTFGRNDANTPVYILAAKDITVAGIIDVSGSGGSQRTPGKGGPGGFDGGMGGGPGMGGGKGLGPGGGNPGSGSPDPSLKGGAGGGGGFATAGEAGQPGNGGAGGTGGEIYGNEKLFPSIGGSGGGGGGGGQWSGGGGGGGGGALVIASSGTIYLSGGSELKAYGAACGLGEGPGGVGSGGSIRLVADVIDGSNGIIRAFSVNSYYAEGGDGRIRLEARDIRGSVITVPTYSPGNPAPIFISNLPSLTIKTIRGVTVPGVPKGQYGSVDVTLPAGITNPVNIKIEAANIPVGASVTVSAVPEYGAASTGTGLLSNVSGVLTTTIPITLSLTYQSILTAKVTYIVQTAMYYEGEKIEKVSVASSLGSGSDITFITESGREVRSEKLLAMLNR